MDVGESVEFALRRESFGEKERTAARYGALRASIFRFDTGVEAIRLANARGYVVTLPFMGQMVWSAAFDGVELAMRSMFPVPRAAKIIVETYGCFAYHSGLLRNGVPGASDTHALHGEAPCADMDEIGIACGTDARGPWMAVTGARDYAMGFGAHYRATPRVVLRADGAECEIVMEVENLSAAPMDLMYMCHVNFAFAEGARIVQPVPFTPQHVVARTAIPGHVVPTAEYRELIDELAANPARMRVLNEPERYDPEQVFYIKGLKRAPDGLVHFMLLRREGDAFEIAWDPETMPHTIRWILDNGDQRVAAFAMPATCEPEGYTAEKRKGNVRILPSGAMARFVTRIGYVDKASAGSAARSVEGSAE
jgi:Domain of unknown function (DUF4432)